MTDTLKAFAGAVAWRGFGSIAKVEDQPDGTIKVYGIASTATKDSAGETVTSEAMKAALPDYARFPALREMHGLSAAGTVLDAYVDDDGITRIEAHVVDPTAVLKVKTKTYLGFSIGGKVLARDPADRTVIAKLKLNEISLVDRPCNPEATIDLWKVDSEEPEHMTTAPAPWAPANADVIAKAQSLADTAGKPTRRNDYVVKARALLIAENAAAEDEIAKAEAGEQVPGGVEPEAVTVEPVEKAAATDTPPEVVAPANDPLAALEASIEKATAVATPEPVDPPQITPGLADFAKGLAVIAAAEPNPDPLAKGLYTVGRLANVMQDLANIQSGTVWEKGSEGDDSKVPAMLAEQVKGLGAALIAMAREEVAELIAGLPVDAALISPSMDDFSYAEKVVGLVKADTDLIAKAGARNSKGDQQKIQEIHDHSIELGAQCPGVKSSADAVKAEAADDLAKVAAEHDRLNATLAKAAETIDALVAKSDALEKRLADVENTAAPPKAVVSVPAGMTVVSKAADVSGAGADADMITKADVAAFIAGLTPEALGKLQVTAALQRPISLGRPVS